MTRPMIITGWPTSSSNENLTMKCCRTRIHLCLLFRVDRISQEEFHTVLRINTARTIFEGVAAHRQCTLWQILIPERHTCACSNTDTLLMDNLQQNI